MKVVRAVAFLMGCVAFALSALLFYERGLVGFPDGFVTEHDLTRKTVLGAAGGASGLASGWFGLLGWTGPKGARKQLGISAVVYVLAMALFFLADQVLRGRSGGGG